MGKNMERRKRVIRYFRNLLELRLIPQRQLEEPMSLGIGASTEVRSTHGGDDVRPKGIPVVKFNETTDGEKNIIRRGSFPNPPPCR